jgi:XTP/dITP diphosphohydrolase
MKRTVIVATQNPHKLQELKSLLSDLDATVRALSDFGAMPEVHEDRETLTENALKKATESAAHLCARGLKEPFIVLADDSGLEVDALDGAPGVYSARFAEYEGLWPEKTVSGTRSTRKVTYHDNNVKLLRLLRDVSDEKRTARFRCVIALVTEDGQQALAEGACEGRIVHEERGAHGFGYDPLFEPRGYDKTFAELGAEVKDRISHRGRALEKAKDVLRKLI